MRFQCNKRVSEKQALLVARREPAGDPKQAAKIF